MHGDLVSGAPGTLFRFGDESNRSNEAIFLLHGFPGEANQQNSDLAEYLANQIQIPAFVLHYRGLGLSDGRFSFLNTIHEGKRVLAYLSEALKFTKVHLIGHSWGGLVAMNAALSRPSCVGRMVLLSPLAQLPGKEAARAIVDEFARRPRFFASDSLDEVCQELESIRKYYEPIRFVDRIGALGDGTLIIQALRDEEVSPDSTRSFKRELGPQVRYVEVDQGHTFLDNRQELYKLVCDFLK